MSLTLLLQTRRVFVAVLVLGLFAMAVRSVTDPDVWWHLRTGQWILQHHQVPRADPYSFTRPGQPWVAHEWLSEVLMLALYRAGGASGLMIGFAALIAVSFCLVFQRCSGRPYLAAVLTLWGALASVTTWGARPQMLSLFLASVFLFLLEGSLQRPWMLWWTPPLMLLWVNLHAGYLIGIGFVALFLAGEAADVALGAQPWPQAAPRLRRLALSLFLCLGVVPLNPNGLHMFLYPFETLHSPAMHQFIQEWFSPNFHDPAYFPLLLTLLALPAGFAVCAERPPVRDLVLLAVTIPAALRSVRHIPILMLVIIPVLTRLAEAWLRGRGAMRLLELGKASPGPRRMAVNISVLIAFTVFTVIRVREVVRTQPEAEARHFPLAAVAFLDQQRPPGLLLGHYNWGGYLIWKLYPQYQVFIDGRADVYGDELMDMFADSYSLSDDWARALQRYSICTLLLPPDSPLITALRYDPQWRPLFEDSGAVILHRDPPQASGLNQAR